jgi:hypothetical protein
MAKIDLDILIDLAFEVNEGDPIDWGVFRDGKDQTLRMIGASILEQFDKDVTDEHKLIMLSVITKLVAENMILHARLMKTLGGDSEV